MRVVLEPRSDHVIFSQDLFVQDLATDCGFTLLKARDGRYPRSSENPELIVSHNPNVSIDSNYIREMHRTSPVVVHLHYQWNYFNETEKRNIADCLECSDSVIVPAEFLRQEMITIFPNTNFEVVPNGARSNLYFPSTEG